MWNTSLLDRCFLRFSTLIPFWIPGKTTFSFSSKLWRPQSHSWWKTLPSFPAWMFSLQPSAKGIWSPESLVQKLVIVYSWGSGQEKIRHLEATIQETLAVHQSGTPTQRKEWGLSKAKSLYKVLIAPRWTGNLQGQSGWCQQYKKFCKPSSVYFQLLHINSSINSYFNPSGAPIKLGDNPDWLDLQTYFPRRNFVSVEPSNLGKQLHTKLKNRNLNEDQAFFSGWTDRSYLTVCLRDSERLILEGELFYLLTY